LIGLLEGVGDVRFHHFPGVAPEYHQKVESLAAEEQIPHLLSRFFMEFSLEVFSRGSFHCALTILSQH
jgi:hypothetical protein